jgi:hypothetical protein
MEIAYSEIDFNQDYTTLIQRTNVDTKVNQTKSKQRLVKPKKRLVYRFYKIAHMNKDLSFLGRSNGTFNNIKTKYASDVKNPKVDRHLINTIRNNGGLNEWYMEEIEKMTCDSALEARKRQQELEELYNTNLNLRKAIKVKKQPTRNRKNKKITFDDHTKKAKIIRKNQINKENRHKLMNKNRGLAQNKVEEQNKVVEQVVEPVEEQNTIVEQVEEPVEEQVVEQNKAEQNKEVIEQIQTALCLIFDKLNEMKLNQ